MSELIETAIKGELAWMVIGILFVAVAIPFVVVGSIIEGIKSRRRETREMRREWRERSRGSA
jgi:hypothetical protein